MGYRVMEFYTARQMERFSHVHVTVRGITSWEIWSAVSTPVPCSPGWNHRLRFSGMDFYNHLISPPHFTGASLLCNLGQASKPLRASVSAFVKIITVCLRVPVKFKCVNAHEAGTGSALSAC